MTNAELADRLNVANIILRNCAPIYAEEMIRRAREDGFLDWIEDDDLLAPSGLADDALEAASRLRVVPDEGESPSPAE